ncbi:MAG: hypothetical protein KAI40_03245 [Desulfobacterales bacterium]|nr:hypothetical protein [Desulfobacterales bacterium]
MDELVALPVKTWQFFSACKENIRLENLTKLFKVGTGQIYRWSSDPDFAESSQRNPLDRYESLLKGLMDLGKCAIARGAVDRQARIVGCSLKISDAVPDQKTIQDELLDNLPIFAKYQEAIRSEQDINIIRSLHRRLINELDEDMAFIEAERASQ